MMKRIECVLFCVVLAATSLPSSASSSSPSSKSIFTSPPPSPGSSSSSFKVLPSTSNITSPDIELISREDISTFNLTRKAITKHDVDLFTSTNNITIPAYLAMYKEHQCDKPVITDSKNSETVPATIEDNTIKFSPQGNPFLAMVSISPDSDMHGFNVDFGISEYSDGLQFHFNDEQMLCRNEKTVAQRNSFKGEVCVRTWNMTRRGPGPSLRACFDVGAALLSNKYYDINTIDTFNGLTAFVIGLGCYQANATDIEFIENTGQSLNGTLQHMVRPLHNDMCNSTPAYATSSIVVSIAVAFIISLYRH